jgi:hypothetical protein
MKISVYDIIQSSFAVNLEDGERLLGVLEQSNLDDLILSFENIEHLSTLFLNESLGCLAIVSPKKINSIKFVYPEDKPLFSSKVTDVIENALMGDEYDELIDAAKMAL